MNRFQLALSALNLGCQQALSRLSARTGRAWHKPVKVRFEVSTACNLRCAHCSFQRRGKSAGSLSAHEWIEILRGLRAFLGPFSLSFRAGEPLMAPDILFPVIREASSLGVLTCFVTNGTLITEDTAEEIRSSGLRSLIISLDGVRERTHDMGRGVKGVHEKVHQALRRLNALPRRPSIRFLTIIAEHNLEELEPLARWVKSEGYAGITFQALRRYGDGWRRFWPEDTARVSKAIDRLIALKREGHPIANSVRQMEAMKDYFVDPDAAFPRFVCGTHNSLYIRNDGAMQPCLFKPPFGSLRERPASELWRSWAASAGYAEVLGCKRPCILLNCHCPPDIKTRAVEFFHQLAHG